jgi:nucleotide-binding universal stress UspA family protein
MNGVSVPAPVIIGVDGSAAALQAALWAADEATSRNVPILLVYAIDPNATDLEDRAHRLAAAESAVHRAGAAVQTAARPITVEVQIVDDDPTTALIRASASAAMICVGAIGFRHFSDRHVGSTAEALAAWAHCPVAIVRNRHRVSHNAENGWVVALVDVTPDDTAVLRLAVDQALLRHCRLRVVATGHGAGPYAQRRLDRLLARWKHEHPELGVRCEVAPRRALQFLSEHAARICTVVAGAHGPTRHDLFSASGYAALQDTNCLLIADGYPPL